MQRGHDKKNLEFLAKYWVLRSRIESVKLNHNVEAYFCFVGILDNDYGHVVATILHILSVAKRTLKRCETCSIEWHFHGHFALYWNIGYFLRVVKYSSNVWIVLLKYGLKKIMFAALIIWNIFCLLRYHKESKISTPQSFVKLHTYFNRKCQFFNVFIRASINIS